MRFILKTGDKQQAGVAPGQTALSLTDGETEVGAGFPGGGGVGWADSQCWVP